MNITETDVVEVTNANIRVENHGEEGLLACDIKCRMIGLSPVRLAQLVGEDLERVKRLWTAEGVPTMSGVNVDGGSFEQPHSLQLGNVPGSIVQNIKGIHVTPAVGNMAELTFTLQIREVDDATLLEAAHAYRRGGVTVVLEEKQGSLQLGSAA